MTPEWISAIASIVTMVVIAASAVAALLQLRHMRGSNQIELIANWTEVIEGEQFQHAFSYVDNELQNVLKDPGQLRLLPWNPVPAQLQPVRTVANHFESIGSFVRRGIIEPDVACDLWAFVVARAWDACVPVITHVRRMAGTDSIWENFEYLALLSKRTMQEHTHGSYPKNVARLPKDTSLTEVLNP